MNDHEPARRLEISFDGGVVIERLLITPCGLWRYRLEQPPLVSPEADFGDVVQATANTSGVLIFQRVVETSTYVAHRAMFYRDLRGSYDVMVLLQRVIEEGGYGEMATSGLLRAYLPPGSAFNLEIDAELKWLVEMYSMT